MQQSTPTNWYEFKRLSRRRWLDIGGIALCLVFGAFLGLLLWLVAALLTTFAGSQTLASVGISLAKLLAHQLAGGAVGGFLVGLLYPLTRSLVGAAFVGYCALLPYAIWLSALVAGHLEAPPAVALIAGFAWSLVGGAIGLSLRREEMKKEAFLSTWHPSDTRPD
jgi:hypothetical protein